MTNSTAMSTADNINATMSLESADSETTFQFTITGQISAIEGVPHLVCVDGTAFRIAQKQTNWTEGEVCRWRVIPSTDSTGEISLVSSVSCESISTSPDSEDICNLIGRVIQVGKRNPSVQFKVKQTQQKTLKLTLINASTFNLKVGQLLAVQAHRIGRELHIFAAQLVDEEQENTQVENQGNSVTEAQENSLNVAVIAPRQNSPISELPEPTPPNDTALAALAAETEENSWELAPAVRRRNGWEWEAVSPASGRRARVYVRGKRIRVYQYPVTSSVHPSRFLAAEIDDSDGETTDSEQPITDNLTDRLIVIPLGAAKGIGASCFQISIGPYEIVLDCGTRPKGYDPLPALDALKNPDLLLISHAHQDHIGAVPVFHNRFPATRMICTPGTREIAHVMLQDCLKVQQLSEDSPELFDEGDLERTLFCLETQPIATDFEPLPGLKVRFINAGHIVGAACIYLRYGDRSLLYTGDYNTTSTRTTEGLKLADLPTADMLITESTYGADTHPNRKSQETALLEAIAEVVTKGGNVLIPAFALGRAQEIILAIRTNALFHKLKIPIFVDGLVRAITDVFRDNLPLLPQSVRNFAQQKQEPFFDPNSSPPIIPIASPKERPLAMAKPSVIIASSGMLTGGPSIYYACTLLERENAAIFISGYTDEESPGRLLQGLKTGDTVELEGKQLTVRAQIRRFNLSAHADKVGLTQVIAKVNPKHLILIHGSLEALHQLAKAGELQQKHYVHIPNLGEAIEYGQVPEQMSRAKIVQMDLPAEFEVTVEAEVEGAWIRIPEAVVESDPRWQMLAGTGVLKARWDGFNLKLSPLSQQHIAVEKAIASGEDCCAVCQFFTSGKCQGEESPLFGFQVDPNGKCPEFMRRDINGKNGKVKVEIEDDDVDEEENEEVEDFYIMPDDD
ncbi:MBL fold metallo-hydrolase [Aerosakkonema sp. BLCC-F183]|uniref:MBL fold metallo-hydrolase n=1 Tax=Aerosakkonema sp. BLCC-F183 TaxID=3342834 RepID=UPI0035B6BBA7